MHLLHLAASAAVLSSGLGLAHAQAHELAAWAGVSQNGDAPRIVLDGAFAHRVVDGRVVETIPFASPVAACGTLDDAFVANASGAEGDLPTGAAFTPDATRIVVSHRASKNLVVFDAATRAVIQTIALSGSPNDVAVSSDGVHAVTANLWENTISIVDLSAGAEVATVNVGLQPGFVRITPNGAKAVIGNGEEQSVSVVDIASATELHRIPGAGFASTTMISFEPGVVAHWLNGLVCASDTLAIHPDFAHGQIDFFDLAAGTVSSIACDPQPRGIAMTPSGSKVVVAHAFATRRISVVDPATQTITKVIVTPSDLNEPIAISGDGARAAVGILNAVQVVDLNTNAFSPALNTASVDRLATTADGLHALDVGFKGSLVSFSAQTVVKDLNNLVWTVIGAVAPSGQRAALVACNTAEDLLVVNTNGAAGFLEGRVPTGAPPEPDGTRDVEVALDGSVAVATNVLGRNASVIDVASGAVLAVVTVGERPADVAIAPDAGKAVVANLDSTFASVIDLSTFAVTNVPISTRGSEVEISPDGQHAYVAVVSGGDGVWRIALATNTVAGPKLATGDMGSVGYAFNQASGMTLSHDGATLAVCGSFTNQLTLIDTASWSVLANVAVGAFPTRAAFSADDQRIYVANRNANSIAALHKSGATWTLAATIAVGQQPFDLAVDSAAQRLYVCNFQSETVGKVDLTTQTQVATVAVPDAPQGIELSSDGSCAFVASGNYTVSLGPGPKLGVATFGAVSVIDTGTMAVAQSIDTGLPPAELAFDASRAVGLAPSPFGDGLTRLELVPLVTSYCTSKVNSLGCTPAIESSGAPSASAGSGFTIGASSVINNKNGLLFYSVNGPNGVAFQGGHLCVKTPIKRTSVQGSGGNPPPNDCSGSFAFDFNAHIAGGSDPQLAQGAQFWAQYWSRDPASPSTTSLTDALTATIAP